MRVCFNLNGRQVDADTEPGRTLLEFLRARGMFSVKYGCDHGECGACTVLIDGKALNACLVLMHTVQDKQVETLEAFEQLDGLDPIQEAFVEEGAIQCGYCTPGMILSVEALLRENPEPDEADIRDALTGNLCRCTGYVKPVEAVKRIAARKAGRV